LKNESLLNVKKLSLTDLWCIGFLAYQIFFSFAFFESSFELFRSTHFAWTVNLIRWLGLFAFLPGLSSKIRAFGLLMNIISLYLISRQPGWLAPQDPILLHLFIVLFISNLVDKSKFGSREIVFLLQLIIVLPHFTAGVAKLISPDPSWLNGEGLNNLLTNSAWRRPDTAQLFTDSIPVSFIKILSNVGIFIELFSFLCLLNFKFIKRIVIGNLLGMHLMVLLLMKIPEVSMGIIFILLLVWIKIEEFYLYAEKV